MKYYYLKKQRGIFYYFRYGKRRYGFRYTYYDKQHRRREKSSRGFVSSKAAIRRRDLAAARINRFGDKDKVTFGQWCSSFLKRMKRAKKITTYKSYSSLLHHNILPYLSNVRLTDLRPMDYKACLDKLFKRDLSRKTITNVNARVQAVLNDAVANGYLIRNPLAHTVIPNRNRRLGKVIMDDEQLRRFNRCLDKQSARIQATYYTLEGTGLRAGELLGLRWRDVDLAKSLIHVRHTRDEYGLRTPKTQHSFRTIMMSSHLAKILSKYKRECQQRFSVSEESFVILGEHGRPLLPNLVSIYLKKILIESGLSKLVDRFTPHSFRHMIVSRLIDAGIKPTAVAKMMGHSSVQTTLSIYAQSAPHEMIDMNKALDKIHRKESN